MQHELKNGDLSFLEHYTFVYVVLRILVIKSDLFLKATFHCSGYTNITYLFTGIQYIFSSNISIEESNCKL